MEIEVFQSTSATNKPVSDVYPLPVKLVGAAGGAAAPTSILDGTATGVGTAAQKLVSASTPCTRVTVQADPGNSTNVLVGNSASQSFVLQPGGSKDVVIDDASKIYVRAAGGTVTVNWAGEPPY